jgi:hypothetical protein
VYSSDDADDSAPFNVKIQFKVTPLLLSFTRRFFLYDYRKRRGTLGYSDFEKFFRHRFVSCIPGLAKGFKEYFTQFSYILSTFLKKSVLVSKIWKTPFERWNYFFLSRSYQVLKNRVFFLLHIFYIRVP